MKLPIFRQEIANCILYGAAIWVIAAWLLGYFIPASSARGFAVIVSASFGWLSEATAWFRRRNGDSRPRQCFDSFASALGGMGMLFGGWLTGGDS